MILEGEVRFESQGESTLKMECLKMYIREGKLQRTKRKEKKEQEKARDMLIIVQMMDKYENQERK